MWQQVRRLPFLRPTDSGHCITVDDQQRNQKKPSEMSCTSKPIIF